MLTRGIKSLFFDFFPLFFFFFLLSHVLKAFWKLEITPATAVPCFSCRSCQFSVSCSRATGCCSVHLVTSCPWADSEESQGAMLPMGSFFRNPHLPMVQDVNAACDAEINHLAIEITNAAVKLIAFLGVC